MTKKILFLLALAAAIAPAAAADVVHLKDGTELAGETTDGLLEVRVETPAGAVTVPWSRIDRIDRGSYVRSLFEKRAATLAADDAEGHFLLALWCRRQGLAEPMRTELERVLAIRPDHAGARAALGYEKVEEKWVAGDELLGAKGFVRRDGRWILEEEARIAELAAARNRKLSEPETKAEELVANAADANPRVAKFARKALDSLEWPEVRIPLYRALADRDPAVRRTAAELLPAYRSAESVRPLLRSALLDTDETVRTAAVAALKTLDEPGTLFPMVRALASANPSIRMNAAAAVGGLGDVRGIEYLIRTLGQNWGPSPRVNIEVLNQVSYIRDFDVEIAQAAQIGDPIVGILREGVILDVRVLGANRKMTTVERRVIRNALANLAGVDRGDEAAAWQEWWGENKERLLAEAR